MAVELVGVRWVEAAAGWVMVGALASTLYNCTMILLRLRAGRGSGASNGRPCLVEGAFEVDRLAHLCAVHSRRSGGLTGAIIEHQLRGLLAAHARFTARSRSHSSLSSIITNLNPNRTRKG